MSPPRHFRIRAAASRVRTASRHQRRLTATASPQPDAAGLDPATLDAIEEAFLRRGLAEAQARKEAVITSMPDTFPDELSELAAASRYAHAKAEADGFQAVLDRFRRWRAGGCVMGPKQLSAVQQQAMGHVQQALAVLNAGVKRLEVFVETRQAMTRGRVVRTALEGKWLAKAAKLIDDLDLVLMRLEEVTELNRAEDLLRDVMGRLVAKRWDKEQRAKLAEDFERRKAEAKAAWTAPIIDPAAEAAVAVKPSRWR